MSIPAGPSGTQPPEVPPGITREELLPLIKGAHREFSMTCARMLSNAGYKLGHVSMYLKEDIDFVRRHMRKEGAPE